MMFIKTAESIILPWFHRRTISLGDGVEKYNSLPAFCQFVGETLLSKVDAGNSLYSFNIPLFYTFSARLQISNDFFFYKNDSIAVLTSMNDL